MSMPATLSTHIHSVPCLVSGTTSRTLLTGVGRIYLLYLDTKPFRFVGDEQGELIEAPTMLHAVVFAGFRPTTCTCGALADACQGLHFDRAYPLLMGMVDHLPGKLMVDVFHPSGFFAPAFLDGAGFPGFLKLFASAIEASAHVALISSIAKEAGSLPCNEGDSRNFYS